LHAILHSGRNFDVYYFIFAFYAFAVAMAAFIGYNFTFALAVGANRRCLHSTQNGVGYPGYAASAVAGVTGGIGRAALGSAAFAMSAGNLLFDFDLFLGSVGDLFEIEFNFDS
jgi:LytS/YehU family sensor histidine kinase